MGQGVAIRWHGVKRLLLSASLGLGVLVGSALVGPLAPPAVAQTVSLSEIAITGNQRVSVRSIESLLQIAPGATLTEAALNDAYQRVVNSGLFETVEFSTEGGVLQVVVSEWPTIGVISFEGNRRITDEALAEVILSKPRRIYTPTAAATDAARVVEAYGETGRLAATVEPKIIRRPDNVVDLVFEIAEGAIVEVERLAFIGNSAFSDRRLRQVLQTRQAGIFRRFVTADTYSAERVEVDKQLLRDFYFSRGFIDFQVLDATAEITRGQDAILVTFSIREGLPYRIGTVTTSSSLEGVDAAEFQAQNRVRTGAVYSPLLLENTIARMETLAVEKGIAFARVTPRLSRNEADQTIDVEFALERGPRIFVERIDITGNVTTLDRVIRRQFRIVEGDPFNPREIRFAAERIRALGFFEASDVGTRQGSAPDQVIVRAEVLERPTGSLTFGASYGAADGAAFTVGLSESNFLGRGQFLAVNLNFGVENASSALRFVEPSLLGRDLQFSFGLSDSRSQSQFTSYDSSIIEFRPGLEFPTSANGRLGVFYRLGSNKISGVTVANSSPQIVTDQARGRLSASALGYSFSWDNRRDGLAADQVRVLRFGQEFAGLGGDAQFIKTTASGTYETRLRGGDLVLRATAEAGHLAALSGYATHVTDRFSLTGQLRGFEPYGIGPRDTGAVAEDPLGGMTYAVLRLDAEFPVGLPTEYGIRGGVFADVGSLWSLQDTTGVGGAGSIDDSRRLRAALGVSVLWDTVLGPLRFNFSRAVRKETYDRPQNFDLTISTQF
jgi:outer membrane protein insertion porin family